MPKSLPSPLLRLQSAGATYAVHRLVACITPDDAGGEAPSAETITAAEGVAEVLSSMATEPWTAKDQCYTCSTC